MPADHVSPDAQAAIDAVLAANPGILQPRDPNRPEPHFRDTTGPAPRTHARGCLGDRGIVRKTVCWCFVEREMREDGIFPHDAPYDAGPDAPAATWQPARPGDTPGELIPEHGPTQPVDLTAELAYLHRHHGELHTRLHAAEGNLRSQTRALREALAERDQARRQRDYATTRLTHALAETQGKLDALRPLITAAEQWHATRNDRTATGGEFSRACGTLAAAVAALPPSPGSPAARAQGAAAPAESAVERRTPPDAGDGTPETAETIVAGREDDFVDRLFADVAAEIGHLAREWVPRLRSAREVAIRLGLTVRTVQRRRAERSMPSEACL